jgi:ISXO2-like transposase domain
VGKLRSDWCNSEPSSFSTRPLSLPQTHFQRSLKTSGVINHGEAYVKGRVHTNGIENFWALLKRGIAGTYVAVEPFHLERYVDEQVFRYNNRATADNPMTDFDRFSLAVGNIVGKRVTYAELTGKEGEASF